MEKNFEEEFNRAGEDVEKYKTFSVLVITDVNRIYENGKNYRTHTLQITIYWRQKTYGLLINKSC